MADGILFERLGVQAAAVLTDVFTLSGDAMAKSLGAPDYRYAMVPHPLSNLTPEECRDRAAEVLPEVMAILGLDGVSAPVRPAPAAESLVPETDRISVEDLTPAQVRDFQRAVEWYFQEGWTDGLPVVPVDQETIRTFVDCAGRDAAEVVATVSHLGSSCTVEMAAAAAAMAGCRKEHFPVVLAAVEALEPSFAIRSAGLRHHHSPR